MANVLGNSTPNMGMQAPPPPPLPAGLHAIGGEAPADQNAYVKQNAEMQAPPPPTLPAGMNIVPSNGMGMQAPPPPTLPAGLHVIGETPAEQNVLRQTDGRPKMSLAEAMNAAEQEIIESTPLPKEPVAEVNGGDLSAGDYCFARSGMDGLYYHGRIDSIDDTGADITFFDESCEHVIFAKIYTIRQIPEEMQCFANWNNKGSYYPAKVIDFPEDAYTVAYDENPDIKDTIGCNLTRFAPW